MIYHIYKIVCKDLTIRELYIGSATNFVKRKCSHKANCSNINGKEYNYHVYQFIRINGGWKNWDMVEIEKYDAVDKYDAHRRERELMETLNATLNKNTPIITEKEKIERNRTRNKIRNKENYRIKSCFYERHQKLNPENEKTDESLPQE